LAFGICKYFMFMILNIYLTFRICKYFTLCFVLNISHFADVTISQTRPLVITVCLTFTLICLYVCTPFVSIIHVLMVQFFFLMHHALICWNVLRSNDLKYVYFNGSCFMMFIKDLLTLFGIIAHLGLRLHRCSHQI